MCALGTQNKTVFLIYPHLTEFNRGDIIEAAITDTNVSLLCRIVGLPGENIEIQNKQIIINGQPLKDNWGAMKDERNYPQNLSVRDNVQNVTIRVNQYYCLHDNRQQYTDSRLWGVVNKEMIRGKLWAIGMLGI